MKLEPSEPPSMRFIRERLKPGEPVKRTKVATLSVWLRRFHMASLIFWVIMIYPTIRWWSQSIPLLVFVSLWANIVSHLEGWQTSLIARKEEKKEEEGR